MRMSRGGSVVVALVVTSLVSACTKSTETVDRAGLIDDAVVAPAPTTVELPPAAGPTDLPPVPDSLPPASEGTELEASGLVYRNPTGSAMLSDWMTYVLTNVDTFWQQAYAAGNLSNRFNSLYYYWVPEGQYSVYEDDTDGTHCGGSTIDKNPAYYCGSDDTMVVYVSAAQDLWDGIFAGTQSEFPGDFALAYAIAHEYGHNVEKELGWWDQKMRLLGYVWDETTQGWTVPAGGAVPLVPRGEVSKYYELFADCLAGVWANSAYWQGLLENGDIEEGLAEAYALGGQWYGGDLPDDWHGTADERKAALLYGYMNGSSTMCADSYGTPPSA